MTTTKEDAERLRQLARNILSNAVEYSEAERERVREALEDEPHLPPGVLRELHPGMREDGRAVAR